MTYGMDHTQMSMNNMRECCPPLTARMWKDANLVFDMEECEDDDGIRPAQRGHLRGGATGMEVCMTQDANQFKQAKCVVQEVDSGDVREDSQAARRGWTR